MQYYWVSIISMLFGVGFGAVLGLIPASIARKKGHSFALWWFYGWMLSLSFYWEFFLATGGGHSRLHFSHCQESQPESLS